MSALCICHHCVVVFGKFSELQSSFICFTIAGLPTNFNSIAMSAFAFFGIPVFLNCQNVILRCLVKDNSNDAMFIPQFISRC